MGLCVFIEYGDYVIVDLYDGDKFFCYWYGKGMYYYSNGDMYEG